GNDGNTIDNNNITNAADANRPLNAIYSLGTSAMDNIDNTISNNNIYDFLSNGLSSKGIYITDNSTAWTITGNSFYETTTLAPTAANVYSCINITNSTNGNGFTVSNNVIGGNAVGNGGTFTISSAQAHYFEGIYISTDITTVSNVQNNTIQNIAYTSTSTSPFTGIRIQSGNVNVGTATGNTIGSTTGTGSITVTNSDDNANSYGILNISTGIVDIEKNNIGSFTTIGSTTMSHGFVGIYTSNNSGTTTVSNNAIGGTDAETSINASSTATENAQNVYGISCTGNAAVTISGNTIANMRNGTSFQYGSVVGIITSAGTFTITNNTVKNLSIANATSWAFTGASVIGIYHGSTRADQTITGNTIFNLKNTNDACLGGVAGMVYYGGTTGTNTVGKNFIYGLSVTGASSTGASLYGIKILAGATTYSNNIISLGGKTSTALYGIYEKGPAGNNNNLYYNTVYIGGSLGSGISNKSFCLFSAVTTNARDFRNNIFSNTRSTVGGANLHYAMYLPATGGTLTCSNNDYYAPNTGGILGYYGADKTILPIVTGSDAHSLAINPNFATPGGTSAANYLPSAVNLVAVSGTGITTDYAGTDRTNPAMGAYEYSVSPTFVWNGSVSANWNTTGNWSSNIVPTETDDVSIPDVTRDPIVNEDVATPAVCKDLSIQTGAVLTIATGKALTVNGSLTNSAGVTGLLLNSDATGTGSLQILGSFSGSA
ncbi:MAG: hypothetical protein WCP85_31825, partial [Mariniphaga sp.]